MAAAITLAFLAWPSAAAWLNSRRPQDALTKNNEDGSVHGAIDPIEKVQGEYG